MMLDPVEVIMDDDFCVGCYWASLLLANRELSGWLKAQLEEPRPPAFLAEDEEDELLFTDGPTNAVEILLALHEKGSFNKGKATLKQVMAWGERHLGVRLGHFHNYIQAISRRKGEEAKYINELATEVRRYLGGLG